MNSEDGGDHTHSHNEDTSTVDPDHVGTIARDSAQLADVGEEHPDKPVTHCPEWRLVDLVTHVGGVQRWANTILTDGTPREERAQTFSTGSAAAEYLRDATGHLLETIAAIEPSDPAWNFTTAPQTKAFWIRRQANEVAVHRWDGDHAATGTPEPLRPHVASDVIDEFVTRMIDRVADREALDLGPLEGDVHLHCTDVAGEWTFESVDGLVVVTAEHRKSAVAARGTANDLALLLYGRAERSSVETFGDTELLDRWLELIQF